MGRIARPKAQPRSPLTPDAPKELTGRARAIYRKLAEELALEGYVCQSDWRTVALTAKTEAHAERIESAMEDEELVGKDGRLHPLALELRQVRAQLAQLYGALFLTPRSRSSSRMTEQVARQAGARSDTLSEFLNEA
jgi:phage terminase small subunit